MPTPPRTPIERTCIDRGGTFTDVVKIDAHGQTHVAKVRSDVAVIGELAEGALTYGTTVATNALLERNGVSTLLFVTEGFADLPRIRDMTRPDLFAVEERWPAPLCTRVVEVRGRLTPDGTELEPLVLPDAIDWEGIEAVAVVLLHGARNPIHERAVANFVRRSHPELFVSVGHAVSPEVGYLARIETTLVDAAITPVLDRARTKDKVPPGTLAMRSDGGLVEAQHLRAPDAVLSGPAGGVVAVAATAQLAGFDHVVGLDMGGTSTDVCLVSGRALPRRETDVVVGGVRLRRPTLEIDTIAAGGGSILTNDGVQLFVGPQSAGADPGPQCYGRGGPPTVTDAAVALGLVDIDAFDPPLDPNVIDLPGSAEAFVTVARDAMAAAIRRLAARRGVDLRDHALVAFGGAAGQHAAAVAESLQIRTVLVHPCASVLSAWGQALARRSETATRALWRPLEGHWGDVETTWQTLGDSLPDLDETLASLTLRHQGTDHAIEVIASTAKAARQQFRAAHQRRYGFDRDYPIEIVDVRLTRLAAAPNMPALPTDPFGLGDRVVTGPCRLDSPTTSVWVPEGWQATVEHGLLMLQSAIPERSEHRFETTRTPYGVALWGARFMAVASEAGAVLERTARSVNIRERRDFSCAVFDEAGELVANAPHIPVHLGAMGMTVRDLLARVPDPDPEQHYVCNDPQAGGSHLPDLTVIHPVMLDGRRFFVANRGHHVDVGGRTPGSMPPSSQTLAEEGFVLRHLPLLDGDRFDDGVRDHLVGARQPDTVLADLQAQIAANSMAAHRLKDLGSGDQIAAWMAHLKDAAAETIENLLPNLHDGQASDELDGCRLALTLSVDRASKAMTMDFRDSHGVHAGNLNAPSAVVRAAVLFALRVLAGSEIPLNEGVLRRVNILTNPASILDAPAGAAVAGGNVETSQRLVDLVLTAARFAAPSAGTMSNVTLGSRGAAVWSLYETVGGGQGATARRAGPSGRQLHMTNTRATDPEVLEQRVPVRLRRFALRRGSGGEGAHPGGEGLVREIEVLTPATAALLASRRDRGAPSVGGGHAAAPGADQLIRQGQPTTPWDGSAVDLEPGDRVRIVTPGGGGWR
ncbi:MAG: hydantoinase B/oxoprolinase family protein [Myxococcota bacterium]